MRTTAQVAKSGGVALGWFTSSPANIPGSVEIGVRFVTARATPKLILGPAVCLLAMSAFGARHRQGRGVLPASRQAEALPDLLAEARSFRR